MPLKLQWKVIYNAIFTEHKLLLMNMSDGLCHFCKSNEANLTHLFFYSRRMNLIVHEIENKINRVLEDDSINSIRNARYHFILGFIHKKSYIKVFVNFIIILAKWEIWKIRNRIKFDSIQVSNHFVLDNIMRKIRTAVRFLENTNIVRKYKKEFSLWKKFN